MAIVSVKLEGADEAMRKLHGLRASMRKRMIRAGVKAACMTAAKRGRSSVPRGEYGLLKRSLGYKIAKVKVGLEKAVGVVGPRRKMGKVIDGKKIDPVRYAHVVEGGSQPHVIRELSGKKLMRFKGTNEFDGAMIHAASVNHPGSRPTNFLRNIQSKHRTGMSAAFVGKLESELAKQAAKSRPSEVDDG